MVTQEQDQRLPMLLRGVGEGRRLVDLAAYAAAQRHDQQADQERDVPAPGLEIFPRQQAAAEVAS